MASTLAAAGLNRTPLDGDDDDEKLTSQRRRSTPSAAMRTMSSLPSLGGQQPYTDDPTGRSRDFDPYAAYGAVPPQTPPLSARRDGYMPARTSSPPPGGHGHSASTSSMGHMARESAGSFEPLLAAGGSQPPTPGAIAPSSSMGPPMIPPKSPRRNARPPTDEGHTAGLRDSASSVYTDPDEGEDQLVDLTPRQPLEVRNLPDGQRPGADISREATKRTIAR